MIRLKRIRRRDIEVHPKYPRTMEQRFRIHTADGDHFEELPCVIEVSPGHYWLVYGVEELRDQEELLVYQLPNAADEDPSWLWSEGMRANLRLMELQVNVN